MRTSTERFHILVAIMVILMGFFYLLQNLFPQIGLWDRIWPVVPMLLGLTIISMGTSFHFAAKDFFFITGTIILFFSILLFISSIFHYWVLWYYSWPILFPIGFGWGRNIAANYSSNSANKGSGTYLIVLGFVFFGMGLLLFEIVLSAQINYSRLIHPIFWGYLLVCLGIYIFSPKRPIISSDFVSRLQGKTQKLVRTIPHSTLRKTSSPDTQTDQFRDGNPEEYLTD